MRREFETNPIIFIIMAGLDPWRSAHGPVSIERTKATAPKIEGSAGRPNQVDQVRA
jgi:hypothetical protein